MTIDPDVRAVAKDMGLDPTFLQAVVQCEGNILRAVQCSVPSCQTRDRALRITARSLVHRLCDHVRATDLAGFLDRFGSAWAPVGVANDPTNLNGNFVRNMKQLLGVVVCLLWFAVPSFGQECAVTHPALTPLDHDAMLAAYTASFKGTFGRLPSMQPGSGPDDGEYWVRVSDHYGAYSDGICRAGWNRYRELQVAMNGAPIDPRLGDEPARFQPESGTPVPTPGTPPLPSVDLAPVLNAIQALALQQQADTAAILARIDSFEGRAKNVVYEFLKTWGPAIAAAVGVALK